jgi:hypothetical protein
MTVINLAGGTPIKGIVRTKTLVEVMEYPVKPLLREMATPAKFGVKETPYVVVLHGFINVIVNVAGLPDCCTITGAPPGAILKESKGVIFCMPPAFIDKKEA